MTTSTPTGRVLVLGGARMVGAALIDDALARGRHVSAFSRGVSGPVHRANEIDWIRGDRNDPAALENLVDQGPWDRVVDVSPQVPREAAAMARVLAPVVGSYVAVSSVSAQRDWPAVVVDASSPRHEADADDGPEDGDYGRLKAGVELAVLRELGARAAIVRPGVILGSARDLERLSIYVREAMVSDTVALPGHPDRPFQWVDVRDLARACWDCAAPGTYEAVGPPSTWGVLADAIVAVAASHGRGVAVEWVDDAALERRDTAAWSGPYPLWLPESDTDSAAAMSVVGSPELGIRGDLAATVEATWESLDAA